MNDDNVFGPERFRALEERVAALEDAGGASVAERLAALEKRRLDALINAALQYIDKAIVARLEAVHRRVDALERQAEERAKPQYTATGVGTGRPIGPMATLGDVTARVDAAKVGQVGGFALLDSERLQAMLAAKDAEIARLTHDLEEARALQHSTRGPLWEALTGQRDAAQKAAQAFEAQAQAYRQRIDAALAALNGHATIPVALRASDAAAILSGKVDAP